MHRDRLARIGADLLEFIFDKAGAKLVVLGSDEGNHHDLADDLLAVTTVFVASHNGRRSAENKRRRSEEAGKASQKDVRESGPREADSAPSHSGAEEDSE